MIKPLAMCVFMLALTANFAPPITTKYLESSLYSCKQNETKIVSGGKIYDCEDIVRAISTQHLKVKGNITNTLYFSDDSRKRYVAMLDNSNDFKMAEVDRKQLRDFRKIGPNKRNTGNLIGRGKQHRRYVEILRSKWFPLTPKSRDGTYTATLEFLAEHNLRPFSVLQAKLAQIQARANNRTASYKAQNEIRQRKQAKIDAQREAARKAAEPPNRYRSHTYGKATTALVDGNLLRFKKVANYNLRAQYYYFFARQYAKKCVRNPRKKGSWSEQHIETKTDRYGYKSSRSLGTSTYTVELSQVAIAKRISKDVFGFILFVPKDMRSFLAVHSCGSKEVQTLRRTLYSYGRKRVNRSR